MANADCIIIQGSNMAECHPVGFQWVAEAKARGAKVIHVDPRFTRTSAVADKHIPIRAGSDVVLLGALINYVLTNDLWFKEYVVAYTNAATLVHEDYRDAEDLGGLFSGFDPETRRVRHVVLGVRGTGRTAPSMSPGLARNTAPMPRPAPPATQFGSGGPPLEHAQVQRDETLQDPRTVFQILKRHYARYTPEMVHDMCGISVDGLRVSGPRHHGKLRARPDHLLRLRRRLDPALPGSAVHPGRRHPAAAAGQRGPPGRRDHGPARPRQHPGLHRHPDPVQPAARLPADAQCRPP